jgi:hypothetical protein
MASEETRRGKSLGAVAATRLRDAIVVRRNDRNEGKAGAAIGRHARRSGIKRLQATELRTRQTFDERPADVLETPRDAAKMQHRGDAATAGQPI